MPQHSLKSQFLSEFILAFLDVIRHLERINCLLQLILETMLPSLKLLQFIFLLLVVKMAVYMKVVINPRRIITQLCSPSQICKAF